MTKLQKVEPNSPDIQSIWGDDVLNREKAARFLTKILTTVSQSFVIGLHAPFGAGKTFFLERLNLHLQNDDFTAIYFNAWETDFNDDPFLAFMAVISEHINVNLPKSREIINKLEHYGTIFLKKILPTLTEEAARRLLGEKSVEELIALISGDPTSTKNSLSNFAASLITQQSNQTKTLNNFKKYLSEAQQTISKRKNDLHQNIIILIDELDRCRPDYAVGFLECIKHFFSVHGIIFIIAVDDKQLSNYVKTVFGAEIDADLYLRKFIDWRFSLPAVPVKKYVTAKTDQFFAEQCGNRNAMLAFGDWADAFHLTLRVAEHCLTELNIVLRIACDDYPPWSFGYLIALRSARRDLYDDYFKYRNITIKDFVLSLIHILDKSTTEHKNKLRQLMIYTHLSRHNIGNMRLDPRTNAALDEALTDAERLGNQTVQQWASMEQSIGELLSQTIEDISNYL